MTRHLRRSRALLPALSWLALSIPARAYDEQASLDAAASYVGIVRAEPLPRSGVAVDLGAARGIGETAALRASLGYAHLRGPLRDVHAGRGRLEALYLLDVLKVVPLLGAGASLLIAGGDREAPTRAHPGVHALVGVDYLLSRSWVLGLDFRSGILLEGRRVRSASELGLRISRMFELF